MSDIDMNKVVDGFHSDMNHRKYVKELEDKCSALVFLDADAIALRAEVAALKAEIECNNSLADKFTAETAAEHKEEIDVLEGCNKVLVADNEALKAEIEAMKDKNLVTVIVDKRDEWPMWHCQECGDEMRYYNSKYTDNKNVCGSCYNKWVDAQNAQWLPPTEE